MSKPKQWAIKTPDENAVAQIQKELSLPEIVAKILVNRGYTDSVSAKAFIEKADTAFYNPFLMKDMDKAISRIKKAIASHEKIMIFGDYDVDGITSVCILYEYLSGRNACVDFYIPNRQGEGYGLTNSVMDTFSQNGISLIITVDTGITAIEECEYAKEKGIDVIVTDHHECRAQIPQCDAVLNPHRSDCEYPFKPLAGCGVVFKLLCALEMDYVNGGEYNLYTVKDMCKRYIDMVAIGTIADVVPLTDENRLIAYYGLNMLQNSNKIGINALFRATGITNDTNCGSTLKKKKITSSLIGYLIAPRINAAGRISRATRAVELFLTNSREHAQLIAEELCEINRERQIEELRILNEARVKIQECHDINKENVLVLAADNWHHGVIGVVASRITEKYDKPSILISFDPETDGEIGKGSGRSVKGINLVEALSSCEDLLIKFGGHELAAGLSIERKNLTEFRRRINEYVKDKAEEMEYVPKIDIESEISLSDVSLATLEYINRLEPFGAANPVPVFVLRNAKIGEINLISQAKHSKLILQKDNLHTTAMFFSNDAVSLGYNAGDIVDVVCTIDENTYKNVQIPQLIIKEMAHSNDTLKLFDEQYKNYTRIIENEQHLLPNLIPQKKDFALLYNTLKANFSQGGEIDTTIIYGLLGKLLNITQILLMLDVFDDVGIIRIMKRNKFMRSFRFSDEGKKFDLESSEILKRIKSI